MKRILKITVIGICLGLFLVIIQRGFQIDTDIFMRGYWIMAPAVVVGAVLINILYNVSYQRKMRRIAALLDSGKAEEYIAEVEALLQTAKGNNLRNILKMNLAAGYMEAKQYDMAIHLLEELSHERLRGSAVKMCHRLNLCMSYFYTAQYDKAMELYKTSQETFGPYKKDNIYGGNIAIVDILAAMGTGQYGQAERQLEIARNSWNAPRLQDAFREIGRILMEMKNGRNE